MCGINVPWGKIESGGGGISVFIKTMVFPLRLENGENLVRVKKLSLKDSFSVCETISLGNSNQEKKSHPDA